MSVLSLTLLLAACGSPGSNDSEAKADGSQDISELTPPDDTASADTASADTVSDTASSDTGDVCLSESCLEPCAPGQVRVGESCVSCDTLTLTTISTRADWTPKELLNSGAPLVWHVSGGLTLGPVTGDLPVLDLSANTGEATITVTSGDGFDGVTSFQLNAAGITSITNVACLANATVFALRDNPLAAIDVSGLGHIDNLTLRTGQLEALDLSSLATLRLLWVYDNSLSGLDLSHNPSIEYVKATDNALDGRALDQLLIDLDAHGKTGGTVLIADNAGAITAEAFDAYTSLIAKNWTIDVAPPSSQTSCEPGYALDGATCMDLDECAGEGTGHDCHSQATCANTAGAFVCTCADGYVGNGKDCAPAPSGTTVPRLSGFRVEAGQPARVYFDSSEVITGATADGFIVPGATLTGLVVSGSGSGHYFTTSNPFTFWDNNTVRYEGGSDIRDLDGNALYPFTLQHIENRLAEPSTSNALYVDASVTSSGDGSSEAQAFATINEAAEIATAGTTVWVKAGDYGNEEVLLTNNGTANAPIKLMGYKTSPGDAPVLARSEGMGFDASELPLLRGTGGGVGITTGTSYIIVKHFQVENFADSIMPLGRDASAWVLDNVYAQQGVSGVYINDTDSENARITRSYFANFSSKGIRLQNKANLIDDTWVISTKTMNMDYYIVIYGGVETQGRGSVVKNCYIKRFIDDSHTGHGISLKAGARGRLHEHNLIEDCEIVNSKNGSIEFRHSGVRYNVARRIDIHHESTDLSTYGFAGIGFENGCSHNIVEDSVMSGRYGVTFIEGVEDGSSTQPGGDYNLVVNSIIRGSRGAIYVSGPTLNVHNQFIGCTFYDNENLVMQLASASGDLFDATNLFTNCLFSNVAAETNNGSPTPSYRYSDFDGGFPAPAGPGNISVAPNFVDTVDLAPQNAALRAGIDMPSVPYDRNGAERGSPPTIGATEL